MKLSASFIDRVFFARLKSALFNNVPIVGRPRFFKSSRIGAMSIHSNGDKNHLPLPISNCKWKPYVSKHIREI